MSINHKKKWKTNRCVTLHFVMHVCLHPFVHLTSPDVLSIAATLDKTSLGFWQEKIYTTSHDWKTHITIVKE